MAFLAGPGCSIGLCKRGVLAHRHAYTPPCEPAATTGACSALMAGRRRCHAGSCKHRAELVHPIKSHHMCSAQTYLWRRLHRIPQVACTCAVPLYLCALPHRCAVLYHLCAPGHTAPHQVAHTGRCGTGFRARSTYDCRSCQSGGSRGCPPSTCSPAGRQCAHKERLPAGRTRCPHTSRAPRNTCRHTQVLRQGSS
jgi:hypothetical protein